MKKLFIVTLVILVASLMMTFASANERKEVKHCIKKCDQTMERCKKDARGHREKKAHCKKVNERCQRDCKAGKYLH